LFQQTTAFGANWPRYVSGGYEYLAVKSPNMTWEAACRYPNSTEFRRTYGYGWIPAGTASPEQWAAITNIVRSEGFARGEYGPAIGVVQNVILTKDVYEHVQSNEPSGGWFSLIAGLPEDSPSTAPAPVFADWADDQPDDGQKPRKWYRRPSFAKALTDLLNLGISTISPSSKDKVSNVVDFVVQVVTNPANEDHQDSGMIFVETDGKILLKDVTAIKNGAGVILMRPLSKGPGSYPSWPKVGKQHLLDGDAIPRVDAKGNITKITWSWNGVRNGKLRLENTDTGAVIYDDTRATPSWTIGGLPPGNYRIWIRRISAKDDPWLIVSFVLGSRK
jgi:hypothetical protein